MLWLDLLLASAALAAALALQPWRALAGSAPPWPALAWWALMPLLWFPGATPAQQILIAKLRVPDHDDRLIQTLMALRLYDRRRDGKLPPQGFAHFEMESDTEGRAGGLPVSRAPPLRE